MKARIKGTDDPFKEIESVTFVGSTYVDDLYNVPVKDLEFEQEQELTSDHWQDVRERAAIAALQGLLSAPLIEDINLNSSVKEITDLSVILANALVKKLKGE